MDRAALKELADSHTKSLDQVFHGYVVLLNNRVWVTDIGIIFHPSREIAIRRFYNEIGKLEDRSILGMVLVKFRGIKIVGIDLRKKIILK